MGGSRGQVIFEGDSCPHPPLGSATVICMSYIYSERPILNRSMYHQQCTYIHSNQLNIIKEAILSNVSTTHKNK